MNESAGGDVTESNVTEAVLGSFARTPDGRLREVMGALTRHLHAFVREVEPSPAEWQAAIEFLTAVGAQCTGYRQEFILLSDVLGVSMLVDAINNRSPVGATQSTVLGPFHVIESPVRALGADISDASVGEPCLVRGRTVTTGGDPIPHATIDVWQADADGFYDVQKPDTPDQDLRGLFTSDGDGRYRFRTILPRYYPIPDDGPVGSLLRATDRHPFRPAHIHLIVSAPECESVTTHLFLADSPYLDDDTVFGVKQSLIRRVTLVDDEDEAAGMGLENPFRVIDFDVALVPLVVDR